MRERQDADRQGEARSRISDLEEASYLELSQNLRRLARRLVADDAQADDLVQEAWLAALDEPPERVRNLNGWLRQVVRNLASRARRREVRRRDVEVLSADEDSVESSARLVDQLSTVRLLRDAVEGLREPYRTVLLERFFEGRSPEEIATRSGASASTVRSQISRGVAQLRDRLDQRHQGERRAWSTLVAAWVESEDVRAKAPAGESMVGTATGLQAVPAAVWIVLAVATIPLALWWGLREPRTDGRALEVAEAPAERVPVREIVDAVSEPERTEAAPADEVPEGEVEPAQEPEPVELAVAADERLLNLQVLKSDGTPAQKPIVLLFEESGGHETLTGDDAGNVRLVMKESRMIRPPRVPMGTLGMRFVARDPDEAWSSFHTVPVPDGPKSLVVRSRGPAGELRGRIVDADGGPLANAMLTLDEGSRLAVKREPDGSTRANSYSSIFANARGEYRAVALPRRDLRVRVYAQGFPRVERMVRIDQDVVVEDFVVEQGAAVVGFLTLPDGSPAAGARVWAPDEMARERGVADAETLADEQGLFILRGLAPASRYIFAAMPSRPDWFASTLIDVPREGEVAWDATLAPAPGVRARILDESGTAIESALIVVYLRRAIPPWADVAHSDAEGRVHFPHVPEGDLGLLVRRSASDVHPTDFVYDLAGEEMVVRLAENTGVGAAFHGFLHDANGQAIPGASIAGASEVGEFFIVETDPDTGAFDVGPIEPDTYELLAIVEGQGATPIDRLLFAEGDDQDLGAYTVPAPVPVRIEWGDVVPSAEEPWALFVAFPIDYTIERSMRVIDRPIEDLSLLRGLYRLGPFGSRYRSGKRFEAGTGNGGDALWRLNDD